MARYVMVGCGAAASTAAEAIRRADADAEITLVSYERVRVLARPRLVEYASGTIDLAEIETRDQQWFDDLNLDVRINTRAVSLDVEGRQVTLAGGDVLPYDKLLLTLGMATRPVPFEGADLRGVCRMHFQGQADVVRELVRSTERAVVVGGGLLGQDMTAALIAAGVKVSLLVREDRVGLGQFDPASSRVLADELRGMGADLRLETEVARIEGSDGRVSKVVTKSGQEIPCQLVFVAIGAVPNTAWLQPVGLEVNRGIVVDGTLATNLPNVFAAGSCTEIHIAPTGPFAPYGPYGRLVPSPYGPSQERAQGRTAGRQMIQPSWANALAMGQVAARNMLGRSEQYYQPSSYTTKVGNTMFTLFGAPSVAYPDARYVEFRGSDGSCGALLAENGLVRGGVLVGRHKKAGAIKALQLRDEPVPGLAEMSGRQSMSVSEFVVDALGLE